MFLNVAAYKFVRVDDPDALALQLRAQAGSCALLGTVLVAREGLNLFLAGSDAGIESFLDALFADPRFVDIGVKRSRSDGQPFARLKVKVKPEIISFRRCDASPLERRAPGVSPATLRRWIAQGHDDAGKRLVLLDTRNRQEVAHGTFAGAMTLAIDRFTEFPDAIAARREDLADATVVSFCTGGIRCEKAAMWMRANGIEDVLQLDGGILGYFEQVGGAGYDGACFVFDGRVALDAGLRPARPVHVEPVGAAQADCASRLPCPSTTTARR